MGIAIVASACGKQTLVPPEPEASAPAPALANSTLPPSPPVGQPEPEELTETAPLGPLAKNCDGVSLVMTSVKVTEHGVDAVLELRNGSAFYVPVALPADGSSQGRRNPTLKFELTPNNVAPAMGCGNMNGASAADFVTLAAGATKKLDWAHPPTPSKPGRYSLRATYQNDPQSPLSMLGDNMPGPKTDQLVARARKTVPCTLISNAVAFMWTQPAAPRDRRDWTDKKCNCTAGDPLCSCL